MTFLPEGYEVPKTSGGGYMKFKQGDNKFRILSPVTMGWEYWTEDKKPKRSKTMFKVVPVDADLHTGWPAKHFWAFVVWNFDTKQIEILEITQVTIQTAMQSLINNEDWGDPREYSITVNRTGEKMETTYTVLPSPAKPVPAEIRQAFEEKYVNLEALFTGGNPFDEADAGKEAVEAPSVEINPDNVPF
jgi:hypothetical protein